MEVVRSRHHSRSSHSLRSQDFRVVSRGGSKTGLGRIKSPQASVHQEARETPSVFDFNTHQPPRLDHKGYNRETHKGRELMKRGAKNSLNGNIPIPDWWTDKHFLGSQSHTTKAAGGEGSQRINFPEQQKISISITGEAVKGLSHARKLSLESAKAKGQRDKYTRTVMQKLRKQEGVPHISYDLDGDGFVGSRDYVVSRWFDEGKKNFLTQDERGKAFKAIHEGLADQFVWAADTTATTNHLIEQSKTEDDFKRLAPERLLALKHVKTQTELLAKRKLIEKMDIKEKKDVQDAKVTSMQRFSYKDYYRPQEFVESPKFSATWQKVAKNRVKARKKAGLQPVSQEINLDRLNEPSLAWAEDPVVNSKSLLQEKRKRDTLKEQQKFEKNFETHVDGQTRIENRENCILRLSFKGLDTVTKNQQFVKEKRTKEMIEDMTQKFGNQVLGVHGQELPKFADSEKDQVYWRKQKGYNKKPRCQSLNLLRQEQRYWAKNDDVKLADTTGLQAPVDPFKTDHYPQKSKFVVPEKIRDTNHWPNTDKIGDPELRKGWRASKKWSEQEKDYKCQGAARQFRTFDKIIDLAQQVGREEADRTARMEELIVKQAPRSLQIDVAKMLKADKQFEASLQIGAGKQGQKHTNFGGQNSGNGGDSANQDSKDKDGMKSPISDGNPNGTTNFQESLGLNTNGMTGKASLLQRMQSPSSQQEKPAKGPGFQGHTGSINLSTLAGTRVGSMGSGGSSMDPTKGLKGARELLGMTASSPFRESVARGIVSGTRMMAEK